MTASTPPSTPPSGPETALDVEPRGNARKIFGWGMWDWGTQPFNTVIVTFVFAVYITSESFGDSSHTTSMLAIATALAGVVVAVVAPVLGQNSDRSGKTVRNMRIQTWILAALAGSLYLVEPDPSFLVLGLVLFSLGSIVFELAEVNYNATIEQVAAPENVGRVSGFSWGLGYLGGIIVLALVLFLFIIPDVGLFGVTDDAGMSVRVSMLVCAVWIVLFTLPTWRVVKDTPMEKPPRVGVVESYRRLWQSLKRLWHRSPHTVYFLGASALFRDGLAGVFAFGAVLAAGTFGMSETEVGMFGIVASIIAGFSTIAFGQLDDRIGPKRVIMLSLVVLIVVGLAIFVLHDGGKPVFWVLGLIMTAFVGPAQSASRSYLARIIPEGQAGELFGLYATTGRSVSFLAPAAFAFFIWLGSVITGESDTQYWGILGIGVVLIAGLLVLIPVKDPDKVVAGD